jgi:hypothetical protein
MHPRKIVNPKKVWIAFDFPFLVYTKGHRIIRCPDEKFKKIYLVILSIPDGTAQSIFTSAS